MKKVNLIVIALTACFILYTRSTGAVYFTMGAVLCSLSVKVVKRIIRQPRPPNPIPGRKLKVSYGCVGARFFLQTRGLLLMSDILRQYAEYTLCHDQLLCNVHLLGMSISSCPSKAFFRLIRYSHTFPAHPASLCNNNCHV